MPTCHGAEGSYPVYFRFKIDKDLSLSLPVTISDTNIQQLASNFLFGDGGNS